MRRAALHLLFWLVYLLQDSMLAFLTDANLLGKLSVEARMLIAFKLCFVLLLPKILFTYLLLYVFLDRIIRQNGRLLVNIAAVAATFALTMLLYRAIYMYYFYPYIYNGLIKPQPFFRPVNFLFALMDLGFVSGSAVVIRQIRLQLVGKEKEKQLVKEKLETELKFLKNQTNPHFLFNTLNNIYALARKKSDQTADVVMKLSKILRFMLYESGKKFITIGEEIKLIEDYIDLERIRYNDRLNISFRKSLDDESHLLSPLLLLPFVENAFKHGISETRFDSFIDIQVSLDRGVLCFIIENTREEGATTGNERIGLGNIRRQLELMYTEYEMQVENLASTFRVSLTVNLDKYGKI